MSKEQGAGTSVPSNESRDNGTKVPTPEGYKQTKVGVIPEEWEVVKLRDILKVSQGLQIPISSRFSEPSSNRVFYITIPYVEGKKVEYIEDARKSILCKKDDLLVVRTGSGAGKIIKNVEGAFHNNFFKLKFLTDLDTNFMYAYLINPRTQFLMNTYAGSSAIPDLNHGDFYSLDFLLPPLKEQQKIAKILSTWDDAISKQEDLIKAKEQLKKGLMQKLLSGEIRFDGFDGEWEEVRLENVVKIKKGKQRNKDTLTKEGDYPVVNGGIDPSGYTNSFNTQENTITISEGGNSCGFVNFITEKFWSGGHCYSLQEPKINNTFLYQMLKLNEHQIMRLRVGSGLPNIQKKDINNFKLHFPPKEEQQKIAQVLTTADKEIELLKNELEVLKEQKRGLMQRLLTGEVRVRL